MERRARQRRDAFTVIQLVPQRLPGERVSRKELEIVEAVLRQKLRAADGFCVVEDGYIIVLSRTGEELGRVVGQRLASDVTLRVAGVKSRKWSAELVTYPRDAQTEAALVQIARAAARGQRRGV